MSNFELAKEYFLQGCILLEAQDFSQAELKFKKSLELVPDRVSTLTNLSVAQLNLKKYSEAKETAQKAITYESSNCEAYLNLGLIEKEQKEYEAAAKFFDKAISLRFEYVEAWTNKGNVLKQLKLFDQALICYEQAINLRPDYADAWSNKGAILHEQNCYEDAILNFNKAINIRPDYYQAWSNKGGSLCELRRFDEAIIHVDKSISLNPDYAEAWLNKSAVLYKLKCYQEAISCIDRAIGLNPVYAEAWTKKALALGELKRFDEAISHFEKAISIQQDLDWVEGDLLHTKMKICSWSNLQDQLQKIVSKVSAGEKVINSFSLLALIDDPLLHKKSSEIIFADKYPTNPALGDLPKYVKKDKIRIGYFSADFRNHPVSILTAELFELHDRNKFEVIAFSFGANDKSPIRNRLIQAFDKFIDVSAKSDLDMAKLVREMEIDIAVDLGGYTTDCRTGIFACRCAPMQLSYIGYLGTMGANYYDYLVADKTIIPNTSKSFYSEKILYLPTYQVNDRKRVISEKQFTRAELGLPAKGFVFCCFNNNYKILPDTFDRWMRILQAVEGSVLFLYSDNEWVEDNLKNHAEDRGINQARLVFGGRLSYDEYLARYRICDLFLDTAPYNAGTTASDALWAGLPVLTLMGQSFASRVAASLLNAIELPELITKTPEEYEALAIELATNPQKLADIKLKLVNNRLTTPLFNTPLFTKNLEAIYMKMYERYQADLPPDHIYID